MTYARHDQMQRYYLANRERIVQRQKEYYLKNRDHIREQQREYDRGRYWENREQMLEKARKYREQHQDKIKMRRKQQDKKYYLKYKDTERYKQRQKEATIKRRYGNLELYQEAMLKYEGECAFACGKKAELVHHLDGKNIKNFPKEEVTNTLTNLLPLCLACHCWLHKPARRR